MTEDSKDSRILPNIKSDRFALLYQVGQVVNSTLDFNEVLNRIMDMVIDVMKAERGYLVLIDTETGDFVFKTARRMDKQEVAEEDLSLSRSIVRKVAETGESVLSTNALQDPRFKKSSSILLHEIRSILCVPVKVKHKILGVIYIDNRVNSGVFNKSDLELLSALSNQAGIAIENAQLYENLQRTLQELQESHNQLQEANALKDEFLANISHELRTPLTSILGFSETIASGRLGELNERYQRCSRYILENGKHMLRLIDDLLDISLVQTNRIVLNREDIDLKDIIEECIKNLPTEKERKKISVSFIIPQEISTVYADPQRLKRIMTNLLDNAIKFNIYDGTVEVRVEEKDMSFEISVADSGIGIISDNFEIIFEKFRQVDGSTTREYGGTGLGLALVKELVTLHGGHVWVESRINVGSIFTFTLPKKEITEFSHI
ncbi:MAG TPA: GAF domain-containing sensor histidine kinase [Candidatus Eremiobacteraeota bacterium]|nr:MAG: Non-motile and phage-resistance protein [bacterium ADurb.Bin363]HPZ07408.1 GAF domain-containing sensor histidine kinase [Candidatus Eremiobacteraeota bacterium]